MILGIDIGGVIAENRRDGTQDTSMRKNYLETPVMPNAIKRIFQLQAYFKDRFIVSRAGPNTQRRSKEWLSHIEFYNYTMFNPNNVYYCFERIDKKRFVKSFGITHFIDDRAEVLAPMDIKHKLLFRPDEANLRLKEPDMTVVQSWDEVYEYVSSRTMA